MCYYILLREIRPKQKSHLSFHCFLNLIISLCHPEQVNCSFLGGKFYYACMNWKQFLQHFSKPVFPHMLFNIVQKQSILSISKQIALLDSASLCLFTPLSDAGWRSGLSVSRWPGDYRGHLGVFLGQLFYLANSRPLLSLGHASYI